MFYKAMLKKKKNKKAFTLIELIVVIAIIGVLVAILVPTLSGFVGNASTNTALANARTVYSVAQAQLQFMQANATTSGLATGSFNNTNATNPLISAVAPQVPTASGDSYIVNVTATTSPSSLVVKSVTYTLKNGTSTTYP